MNIIGDGMISTTMSVLGDGSVPNFEGDLPGPSDESILSQFTGRVSQFIQGGWIGLVVLAAVVWVITEGGESDG